MNLDSFLWCRRGVGAYVVQVTMPFQGGARSAGDRELGRDDAARKDAEVIVKETSTCGDF